MSACGLSLGVRQTSSSEFFTKLKDLVQKGHLHQAFSLYKGLHHSSSFSTYPITHILPSLIKASSLFHSRYVGTQLHCLAVKTASYSDVVVCNSLVSMYAKFLDTNNARQLFDEMPERDPISWNSLINCYIQQGHFVQAIDTFKQMCANGYLPKPELTASVLSVCSKVGLERFGREIHGFVVVSGMIQDSVFLPTALVACYSRSGDLRAAFRVFDQMEVRNEVSWTAMIQGCTTSHDHKMALDCLRRMQADGIKPNRVTLISVMPACTGLCSMLHAKEAHGYAFRLGFEAEPCFSAALMHSYSQFRGARAQWMVRIIMEQSTERDVVMWTAIIGSYARDGNIIEAMKHFNRMQLEGIMPNFVTLLTMVSACTDQVSLLCGRAIHSLAIKSGLFSNVGLGNAMISMYCKCGCLAESKLIFAELPARDSVSWNALIAGHGIG